MNKDEDTDVVAPSPGHISPLPARKQNLLSPDSALQSSNQPENAPPVEIEGHSDTNQPKELESQDSSTSHNSFHSANQSHQSHKPNFLRSLLGKSKKAAPKSNSKSAESAFSSASDDFNKVDKKSWDQKSAEAKRSLWKKSVSTPETASQPYLTDKEKINKTVIEQLQDDNQRERYISSYENEMFSPLQSAASKEISSSWNHYESSPDEKRRGRQRGKETLGNPEIKSKYNIYCYYYY